MNKYMNSHMFEQVVQDIPSTKTLRIFNQLAHKAIRSYRHQRISSDKRYEVIRTIYRMKLYQKFGHQSSTFMASAYEVFDSVISGTITTDTMPPLPAITPTQPLAPSRS